MKTSEQKQKIQVLCISAVFCILLHAGVSFADDKKKEKKPPYDPTSAYEIQKIEGWNVYVLKRLEKELLADTGAFSVFTVALPGLSRNNKKWSDIWDIEQQMVQRKGPTIQLT